MRAAVFIGPTYDQLETTMGINLVDAAVKAGVERFVGFSVCHPAIEFLLNHESKLRFEDYLLNSGLEFTILQPMNYMQNFDPVQVSSDGVLPVPFSIDRAHSWIDLVDLGEAGAIVLTEQGHENATYPLCGPDTLSAAAIAATIGNETGTEVSALEIPIADFVAAVSGGEGASAYTVNALYRIATYYGLHGVVGNPNILRCLLGREPVNFAQYVQRRVAEAEAAGSTPAAA